MNATRRGFLFGAASLLAAPAIVRASSLMPVKAVPIEILPVYGYGPAYEALIEARRLMENWREVAELLYYIPPSAEPLFQSRGIKNYRVVPPL